MEGFSRRGALLFALAAVVALPVASAAPALAQRKPKTVTVVINNMQFGAVPPGLHVGDTVVFDNKDMFEHTATARDGSFDLDLPSGKKGSVVLKKAGKIDVYCRFHPNMTAVLDVQS